MFSFLFIIKKRNETYIQLFFLLFIQLFIYFFSSLDQHYVDFAEYSFD